MSRPWDKPGLTVEERAEQTVRAAADVCEDVWEDYTPISEIVEAALRAARRDALEEAAGYVARIADNARAPLAHRSDGSSPLYGYAVQIAEALDDAAATIRTLATSGEEGEK